MRISAKTDYALRVLVSLADASSRPLTCEGIAEQQGIPYRFLKSVVRDLRLAGLVRSQRGCEGGYWIGREAAAISVADVIAAVDGELLTVNGDVPDPAGYPAPARRLEVLWRGLHAHLAELCAGVTIADLAGGEPGGTAARLFAQALAATPA